MGTRVVAIALVAFAFGGCGGSSSDRPDADAGSAERIAFASRRDGDFDIYTMRPDGTDVRQLTRNSSSGRNEADEAAPAWSHDGERIAFTSTRDHEGDGMDAYELYVMTADGSGQERLTQNRRAETEPAWTHDGHIRFGSCSFTAKLSCDLVELDPDAGEPRVIHKGLETFDFSLSPDGRKIAFVRGDATAESTDIYVADVDGANERRLTHHRGFDADPAWSPDGKKIVFGSDRDRNGPCLFHDCVGYASELYVMRADGAAEKRLTSFRGYDISPAWSPDATRLVFARIRDEMDDYELYVMRADGRCQTRLTDNRQFDWQPAWYARSADGGTPLEC